MFKNGVYLANTRSLGDRVEQFEEGNPSFAILGTVGEPSDLITAYNMQSPPVFRFYQEVSGTVATIPTYVNGDGNLVVFKNGLLMNIGIGDINSTYTESSTTSVTFDAPVDFDDLLSFEYFPSLSWRESQIIASGTAVNFLNPYTIGDGRLMIFRNGLLMVNSLTLGTPIERYSETSVSGITLEQAASGEVFTAIYL
jgi:hypothetical protein